MVAVVNNVAGRNGASYAVAATIDGHEQLKPELSWRLETGAEAAGEAAAEAEAEARCLP